MVRSILSNTACAMLTLAITFGIGYVGMGSIIDHMAPVKVVEKLKTNTWITGERSTQIEVLLSKETH